MKIAARRRNKKILFWVAGIATLCLGLYWYTTRWPWGGVFLPRVLRLPSTRNTISELDGIAQYAEDSFWFNDAAGNRVQSDNFLHEAIMMYGTMVVGRHDRARLPALLNLYAYARQKGYIDSDTAVGFDRSGQIRIIMSPVYPLNRPSETFEKYTEYVLWLENMSDHNVTYEHLHITFHYFKSPPVSNVLNFPDAPVLESRMNFQPTVYQQLVARSGEERRKIAFFPATRAQPLWATVDAGPDGSIIIPYLQNLYHHPWARPKIVTREPGLGSFPAN